MFEIFLLAFGRTRFVIAELLTYCKGIYIEILNSFEKFFEKISYVQQLSDVDIKSYFYEFISCLDFQWNNDAFYRRR